MNVKTVDCLEHRWWRDEDAQDDAMKGHDPHVFRMGWRKRAYRCRGSKSMWSVAPLSVRLVRYLADRSMSIKDMLNPDW